MVVSLKDNSLREILMMYTYVGEKELPVWGWYGLNYVYPNDTVKIDMEKKTVFVDYCGNFFPYGLPKGAENLFVPVAA